MYHYYKTNTYKRLPYSEKDILHKNLRTYSHVKIFMNALESEGQMISFDDALMICLIASINDCNLQLREMLTDFTDQMRENYSGQG